MDFMVNTDIITPHVGRDTYKRDLAWCYSDKAGHEHRWDGEQLPTLRWVVDEPEGIDSEGEEWPEQGHWECALCDERVEPGYVVEYPAGSVVQIPGMQHYFIDGKEVTKDVFDTASKGMF